MTAPAKTIYGWGGGVLALLLLLVGLNWWSTGTPFGSGDARTLDAPDVYYLRPHGDSAGAADPRALSVEAKGGSVEPRGRHRMTADVEPGSEDVVRLRKHGPDCTSTPARTHVTCQITGGSLNHVADTRVFAVAAQGSHVGDVGYVRFTFTKADGRKLTARTKVVVGEPVVEIGRTGPVREVRPGAVVTTPFVVRNSGERTVEGLGIRLGSGQMEFTERYANCRYPGTAHHTAVCTFPDLRVAPGETVVLRPGTRPGFTMRAAETEMYDVVTQAAWPLDVGPGEGGDWLSSGDHGDGSTLTPEFGPAEGVRAFSQGELRTSVGLAVRADYAVSASALHGAPGTERLLRLTVRNDGPGDPGNAADLVFTPPPGAEVRKQPMEEIDEDAYEPYCEDEDGAYTCLIGALAPGSDRTFEFTLRLGEPDTAGSVRIVDNKPNLFDPPDQLDHLGRQDPDPTDDRAAVPVLN
ncbi:hypothetical protein ACWD5F_15615 [Streptomyces sp. NPDC002499]